MIQLHHLENSRSHRILWLLEELELPYEIVDYKRNPKTMQAPPELRQIHPLGKSPVLTDGEVTVAESAAILEYLFAKYGSKRPELKPAMGSAEALRYNYWMHYAEGSLMPPLFTSVVFTQLTKQPLPFFVKPIVRKIASQVKSVFLGPELKRHCDFVEAELSSSAWFCGNNMTLADIQMSFPLMALLARGNFKESPRAIHGFLQRIAERPAYKRAVEKGGKLDISE